MKNLLLSISIVLYTIAAYAQPSTATMMAKVKSYGSTGYISGKLTGSGISEREYRSGAWVNLYRRGFSVKQSTKYKGITAESTGSVQYIKIGGKYVFDQYLYGNVYYHGVQAPKNEEILKLLKADLEKYVKPNNYRLIIGEISDIEIVKDPKYEWIALKHYSFLTKVTYTHINSETTLKKSVNIYETVVYRDEYGKPWTSFNSTPKEETDVVITNYTKEEIKAMKTIPVVAAEKIAKAEYASLPEIGEIPVFESERQLFYFTHNIIKTKDPKMAKAYLYKLLSSRCMLNDVLLNDDDQEWVDEVYNNIDVYKRTFCEYPKEISRGGGDAFTLFDKENKSSVRYSSVKEKGTWKLKTIYYYPVKADDIARVENIETNCQGKPDLFVRKIIQYKPGDKVYAKFRNGSRACVVTEKDRLPNRYRVKIVGDTSGKKYWMNEETLTQRTGDETEEKSASATSKTTNEPAKSNVVPTFQIGDKVKIKTTKGYLKGTLTRYASRRFLVKFDSSRYRDTWYLPANMEKDE